MRPLQDLHYASNSAVGDVSVMVSFLLFWGCTTTLIPKLAKHLRPPPDLARAASFAKVKFFIYLFTCKS